MENQTEKENANPEESQLDKGNTNPQESQIDVGNTNPQEISFLNQILINIVVLGVFFMIQGWLMFYYAGTYVLPMIFGILITLAICLLTINIYQFLTQKLDNLGKGGTTDDKKLLLYIYRHLKKIEESIPRATQDSMTASFKMLNSRMDTMLEDIKKNQILVSKAIMKRTAETLQEISIRETDAADIQTEEDENESIMERLNQLEADNRTCMEMLSNLLEENKELKKAQQTLLQEAGNMPEDLIMSVAGITEGSEE